jgi:hypothetical protein
VQSSIEVRDDFVQSIAHRVHSAAAAGLLTERSAQLCAQRDRAARVIRVLVRFGVCPGQHTPDIARPDPSLTLGMTKGERSA